MFRRLSSRLRDRGTILRASVLAAVEPLERRQLLTAAPVMNPGGPPNGPYNIGVTNKGGLPQISFVDNATNETHLFVQRATAANGPWFNVEVLPPSPGSGQTVTVLDTVTAPGTTYFYRAYAVN